MEFALEGGKKIVLDAEQARRDGPTVLRQHGIVFDRSADLRALTNKTLMADGVPGASSRSDEHMTLAYVVDLNRHEHTFVNAVRVAPRACFSEGVAHWHSR